MKQLSVFIFNKKWSQITYNIPHKTLQYFPHYIFNFICLFIVVYHVLDAVVEGGLHHIQENQRSYFWSHFFPSSFIWAWELELRLPGLNCKNLYLLSHLNSPLNGFSCLSWDHFKITPQNEISSDRYGNHQLIMKTIAFLQ